MANNKGIMSDEIFRQLIKEDYWIKNIAEPTKCYTKEHQFKHYRTCTYPEEYIVTAAQVAEAKQHLERRRKERIDGLQKGDLWFVAMGMDFETTLSDGVGNHRMRCEFKNSEGHHYFLELTKSDWIRGNRVKDEVFYVDFSIDRDLQDVRRMTNGMPQDYYYAMGVGRDYYVPAAWSDVLAFVNRTYGCDYKRAGLFKHFLVSTDDYICKC